MNKIRRAVGIMLASLVLAVATAGCGNPKVTVQEGKGSTGKQLTELKEAYDAGALTEKEYKKAKSRILKGKG